MKSLKRIYISILSVTISMLLFGTVILAFGVLINNVDDIFLSAATGEEFKVSLDGENFYQSLPIDLLRDIIRDTNLIDITTLDGINFQTGGFRELREAIRNEDYISFDLWMRSTEPEKHVFLVNNKSKEVTYDTTVTGTYVVSRGTPWIARHTFLNGPNVEDVVEKGTFGIYHASEAIRISIIELTDDKNPNDTRNQETLRRFIFDPSENPERGYGVTYGAFSYFFQMANYNIFPPVERPDTRYRLSEMDPNNPYQALDNESWVATLQDTGLTDDKGDAIYQVKIRVNVWIEGWDADTFDALDMDQVKIQLQFKLAHKANPQD